MSGEGFLAMARTMQCRHGVSVLRPCVDCYAEPSPAGNAMPSAVAATLDDREGQYGAFSGSAAIAQALKSEMFDSPNWSRLKADQREALQMIASKLGRLLNGDPDHFDSWHDIAGFAQLVADRIATERENAR